jgi:integrase
MPIEKLTKTVVEALEPRSKPYDARDSELRGFLVRVHPSGHKVFYFDYRLPSWPTAKRARLHLGPSDRLSADGARRKAKVAAGEVQQGIDPHARKKAERAEGDRRRHGTLRAFLDGRYEEWARAHLRSHAFQLARLRSDFKNHLDKPLTAFNSFFIDGIRREWRRSGLKERSINRDVQRLQSVLGRAVEWGVVATHPLAGLKPLKADKTGRVRYLSADEEAALRAALDRREEVLRDRRARFNEWRLKHNGKRGGVILEMLPEREGANRDYLRPLVLVALNTGLRRGELLGLRWNAVDLASSMLTVTAATAKSGHTRRVPLNSEIRPVLKGWYEAQGAPQGQALVFPGRDGRRMARIDSSWRAVLRAANISDFRLHDCRHHFASRLVQAGVDLYKVKVLLGHSEIAMTERYAHLAPENLRAAVEYLAA